MHLHVIYSIAAMHSRADGQGPWQGIVTEQLDLLQDSGLGESRSIQATFLGPASGRLWVMEQARNRALNLEIVQEDEDFSHFETFAIHAVERWASAHEGAVLYLHTKGVSAPLHAGKRRWRHWMQDHLVRPWRENLTALADADAIGVNWREMPPVSHFCGNFWMARCDYLRTLEDFAAYHSRRQRARTNCEFWISSGSRQPRVISLADRDVDYNTPDYFGSPAERPLNPAPLRQHAMSR